MPYPATGWRPALSVQVLLLGILMPVQVWERRGTMNGDLNWLTMKTPTTKMHVNVVVALLAVVTVTAFVMTGFRVFGHLKTGAAPWLFLLPRPPAAAIPSFYIDLPAP